MERENYVAQGKNTCIDDHWNGLMGRKLLLKRADTRFWKRAAGTKD
jgi:hypothetical protein